MDMQADAPRAKAQGQEKERQEAQALFAQSPEELQRHLDETLCVAVSRGDTRRVAELLARGADPQKKHEEGKTPLMSAAITRSVEIIDMLLPRLSVGAIDERNEHGMTALMFAACYGSIHGIAKLLAGGANPLAADNDAETALHFAARHGWEAAATLLAPFSDLGQVSAEGRTAEAEAMASGKPRVAAILGEERARREREALLAAAGGAAGAQAGQAKQARSEPGPAGAGARPASRKPLAL
jgi:ankyrin repeat protein